MFTLPPLGGDSSTAMFASDEKQSISEKPPLNRDGAVGSVLTARHAVRHVLHATCVG